MNAPTNVAIPRPALLAAIFVFNFIEFLSTGMTVFAAPAIMGHVGASPEEYATVSALYAAVRSFGVTGGTARSKSCVAASTNTPAGAPFAPFSIRPPVGEAVVAVIFAARIAALFAQAAWPSARLRYTGRSARTASRSAAVGKRPSPHFSWFQPVPIIQARSGLPLA